MYGAGMVYNPYKDLLMIVVGNNVTKRKEKNVVALKLMLFAVFVVVVVNKENGNTVKLLFS